MSEIIHNESSGKSGVRKAKKNSVRVDLTPMVDLGFLLISFFVFTTSIAHPTALGLKLPDDSNVKDSMQTLKNKTISLLLAANNEVCYYNGDDLANLQHLGSGHTALRSAILEKKSTIRLKYGSDSDMVVLIKPAKEATYANVINALDEMQICGVKTYVLMDANDNELMKVKQ